MKDKYKYILIALFIVLSTIMLGYSFIYNQQTKHYNKNKRNTVTINNTKIFVEVQSTMAQLSKGLMFRLHMPKEHGMLFLLNRDRKHTFWMVNTFIPLDIIWIDKNNKIVDISKNTKPMNWYNWPYISTIFYSPKNTAYNALEVNAGFTDENNIKIGDIVIFNN